MRVFLRWPWWNEAIVRIKKITYCKWALDFKILLRLYRYQTGCYLKKEGGAEKNWRPHFGDPSWIPPDFIFYSGKLISCEKISAFWYKNGTHEVKISGEVLELPDNPCIRITNSAIKISIKKFGIEKSISGPFFLILKNKNWAYD